MKIGFGKAVITPPVGFSLVGYFNDRRSTGIRDDLYAIACLLEDKGQLFAVVSVDLVWIDASVVKRVREIAHKAVGIPVSNVLVHAVHTHTGPVPDYSGGDVYTSRKFYVEPCYIEMLPLYIAGSIKAAYENRKEVSVGTGTTQVEGLAFNRRYFMKDGRVITNPWNRVEDIVEAAGPVDNTLGVIKITDRKTGELTGVIINFACHPDTLGDTLISADWPGMLRSKLKSEFPGAEVLLLNGPSGDINHINPREPGKRGIEIPDHIAETLKKKTLHLLKGIKTTYNVHMKTYSKKFSLPYREISNAELRSAKKSLKEKNLPADSLQYMVSSSLIQTAKESKVRKKHKLEINGFSIGSDLVLVSLPGEIFTEIGLGIKKLAPFRHTLLAQNSNAHLGYVPSETAFLHEEKNFTITPGYGRQSLTESFGIDCSYETSPLCCKVGKNAEKVILKTVKSLF